MEHLAETLGEVFGFAFQMKQPENVARWRPSPLLVASAAVHLGAAAALIARPRTWPWSLGALLANHVVLAAAGLWPRSHLLGPNWTRLPDGGNPAPGVAITIDDGPDPDITPQVLE